MPLTVLSQLGGHSAKRTHRAPDVNGNPVPIGYKIMSALKDVVNNRFEDKIEVRCGMKVTKLIHHVDCNGVKTVTGVEVNENGETLHADAVVLATGGFGCCQRNDGLMARFRPDVSAEVSVGILQTLFSHNILVALSTAYWNSHN